MLSAFFGVKGVTDAEPGAPSGEAATLRVLPGGRRVDLAPWVEVEPFLAASLAARGLPSRFRILPETLRFDLPVGDPLLCADLEGKRRVVACRTPEGAVVLGFDPQGAEERWLRASAPAAGLPGPLGRQGLRGSWRRLARRVARRALGFGGRRPAWGGGVDVDALRFACWSLLEETETGPLPVPAPFWPGGARAAFALTFDLFDVAGWIAWRRGRERGAGWAGGGEPVTCFVGRRLLRARPGALRELSLEGCAVGILEEDDRAGAWARATAEREPAVRCVRRLGERSGGARAASRAGSPALGGERALSSSSTVGWDAASARGVAGTVFPYGTGAGWELPVARPASPPGDVRQWVEALGGVCRLGGAFVARVPLSGRLGSAEEAALSALVCAVRRDAGIWSTTVPRIADWWGARAARIAGGSPARSA